jgi:competence protein ComEC
MRYLLLIFLVLIGFNIFVWHGVFASSDSDLDIYFLDVGQGDSELVILPGGVRVLIDGGPDKEVLFELSEILPQTNKYIDLVVITHPETDHFGGLYDVIERYGVGAVIASGREGTSDAWSQFVNLLGEKDVPIILVSAGDLIGYKESSFAVLSPTSDFLNDKEVNESSIVLGLQSEDAKSLFTGDIGFGVENYLVDTYDIDADILKVAHHGSRFSTGQKFLSEVTPRISVIEVGKNSFGHPTQAALNRLMQSGSSIYRTDQNGTVHIKADEGVVGVFVEN